MNLNVGRAAVETRHLGGEGRGRAVGHGWEVCSCLGEGSTQQDTPPTPLQSTMLKSALCDEAIQVTYKVHIDYV